MMRDKLNSTEPHNSEFFFLPSLHDGVSCRGTVVLLASCNLMHILLYLRNNPIGSKVIVRNPIPSHVLQTNAFIA